VLTSAGVAATESKTPPASHGPGPLVLDDAPLPLAGPQPQSEAQRDRVDAIALFAAGRRHQQREEYADALRCYQRALRCDPQSSAIARAIVPVAVQLGRNAEAVAYAPKAEDVDPLLLCRLGDYLTNEGDWAQAIIFYGKAQATRGKDKETARDILLRMEMGRLYYLTEKRKEAAESFARVLYAVNHPEEFALDEQVTKTLLGDPDATYQLMGECFLAAGRPEEARAAFEKADHVAPNTALWRFNLARLYAKTGKPAEALSSLETALAAHLAEQGMVPYETLADVLRSLGKSAELLERLEKLRAAEPKNLPLGYYLAAQYRAAGKPDKAESLYLALLKDKPTLVGYRSLVEMYLNSKRFDALLAVFGEALETTGVLEILGAEAQTISGDAESMRRIVETARSKMKANPEKFGYGMRLGTALLALEAKQYEAASEFFNLALAVAKSAPKREGEAPTAPKSPAPPKSPAVPKEVAAGASAAAAGALSSRAAEVLMAWGIGLLLGDRPDEAAKVFRRAIDEKALPDDNPAFYFYLAGALAMTDRPDEALVAARIAAAEKRDSARFRGRVAWVLYAAKRYPEAEKAYRQLLNEFDADYASTETRDVLREARLALSNIAAIRDDLPQAEEWLEQVLDEFPDDEGALNDLGYLWADQGKRLERAKRMIERAVAAEPDNMAYRDSLGWVLFRLGKYPQAVVELEKAAPAKKPDPVVFDHLGDAYQKAGQHDKAKQTWRKAAEAFRTEKDAEKAAAVEKKIGEKKIPAN
jgi:tetratricopeptide (TPR) repeat protein